MHRIVTWKLRSIQLLLVLVGSLTLLACSSDSKDKAEGSESNLLTGQFIDSEVQGLEYETESRSGVTGSNGEFRYLRGEVVRFFLGGIQLGESKGSSVVTPQDLVLGAPDTDPRVVNIVRLLLTLDEDGDPDNGIQIHESTKESAKDLQLDLQQADLDQDQSLVGFLAGIGNDSGLVSAEIAKTHFAETLAELNTSNTTYKVGGIASGITSPVKLRLNDSEILNVSKSSVFAFDSALTSGTDYTVDLFEIPASLQCVLENATGTVQDHSVTSLRLRCSARDQGGPDFFSVGGAVSGLDGLLTISLGNQELRLTSNDDFSFPELLPEGISFNVQVERQPLGQICDISNGTGAVDASSSAAVSIVCQEETVFTVGGTITGLSGTIELDLNGEKRSWTDASSFRFPTGLAEGSPYVVTITGRPTGQTCSVANGSGTIGQSNVDNIAITCSANRYSVRGTIENLQGELSIFYNGADEQLLSNATAFEFSNREYGSQYSISTGPSPRSQTCSVVNGSGTIGAGDVEGIRIVCIDKQAYAVSVEVSGLDANVSGELGLSLAQGVMADVASENVAANTSFAFAYDFYNGEQYTVSLSQPKSHTCKFSANDTSSISGTIAAADTAPLLVECSINVIPVYPLSVSVSGLAGETVTVLSSFNQETVNLTAAQPQRSFATQLEAEATTLLTLQYPASTSCYFSGLAEGVNLSVTMPAAAESVAVICSAKPARTLSISVTDIIENEIVGALSLSVALDGQASSEVLDSIVTNGTKSFSQALYDGQTFTVSVASQPDNHRCLFNGEVSLSASVSGAITAPVLSCSRLPDPTYPLTVQVTGLSEGTLEIESSINNERVSLSDQLGLSRSFTTKLVENEQTVLSFVSTPSTLYCAFAGRADGEPLDVTMLGSETTVDINCRNKPIYTLSVAVSGLGAGTGDSVTVAGAGTDLVFTDNDTKIADATFYEGDPTPTLSITGTQYHNCTDQTNPPLPTQFVKNETVSIVCDPSVFYSIAVQVSGVENGSLVISDDTNGGSLTFNQVAGFVESKSLTGYLNNQSYSLSLDATQLNNQSCSVVAADQGKLSGTTTANIDIAVVCDHAITVTPGTGATADITVANNGGSTSPLGTGLSYSVAHGDSYSLTISNFPTGYDCSVSNSSSDNTQQAVTTVVSCTGQQYGLSALVNGTKRPFSVDVTIDSVTERIDIDPASDIDDNNFLRNVAYGTSFTAAIGTQPPGANCSIINNTEQGVMSGDTAVEIDCTRNDLIANVSTTDTALKSCIVDYANSQGWTRNYQLTRLVCPYSAGDKISDLQGIGIFANLKEVVFDDHAISSVMPLLDLFLLEQASLKNNPLVDSERLKELPNLITAVLFDGSGSVQGAENGGGVWGYSAEADLESNVFYVISGQPVNFKLRHDFSTSNSTTSSCGFGYRVLNSLGTEIYQDGLSGCYGGGAMACDSSNNGAAYDEYQLTSATSNFAGQYTVEVVFAVEDIDTSNCEETRTTYDINVGEVTPQYTSLSQLAFDNPTLQTCINNQFSSTSTPLLEIKSLDVSNCGFTQQDVVDFYDFEHFYALEQLTLGSYSVVSADSIRSLVFLDQSQVNWEDIVIGLNNAALSPYIENTELRDCIIRNGQENGAAYNYQLTELSCEHEYIDSLEGLKHFQYLQTIDLSDQPITEEQLPYLDLPNLVSVNLSGTPANIAKIDVQVTGLVGASALTVTETNSGKSINFSEVTGFVETKRINDLSKGDNYSLSINSSSLDNQNCDFIAADQANASGFLPASLSVSIICDHQLTVTPGTGAGADLTIQNNGGAAQTLGTGISFAIEHGAAYSLTVGNIASGYECAVSNGSSASMTGPVTAEVTCEQSADLAALVNGTKRPFKLDVDVDAASTTYTIDPVSETDDRTVLDVLAIGSTYANAAISKQPPGASCGIINSSGAGSIIAAGNTIEVSCTANDLVANLSFADAELDSCIKGYAQAQGWTKVYQVTGISCPFSAGTKITNLAGINSFFNLKTLNLDDHNITTVTPLLGLNLLEQLSLQNNPLTDSERLKELPNLLTVVLFDGTGSVQGAGGVVWDYDFTVELQSSIVYAVEGNPPLARIKHDYSGSGTGYCEFGYEVFDENNLSIRQRGKDECYGSNNVETIDCTSPSGGTGYKLYALSNLTTGYTGKYRIEVKYVVEDIETSECTESLRSFDIDVAEIAAQFTQVSQITFNDSALQQCIENQAQTTVILEVNSLDLSTCGFATSSTVDITGMEHLYALSQLQLGQFALSNAQLLDGLKLLDKSAIGLEKIMLGLNETELSPYIPSSELRACIIRNAQAVGASTNYELTELTCEDEFIDSLQGIAHLQALTRIDLTDQAVSTEQAALLNDLPNLTETILTGTPAAN